MNLPEKRLHQRQLDPMTHEEALDIINRASKDKHLAREVDFLRERCCLFINDVMNDINLALAEREKKLPALLRGKADSAVSLRVAAQEREQMARQRRELAEAMVIGALANMDNPGWNPIDGTGGGKGKGGLLMALIKTSSAWKDRG
ncbi:hypothetical protein [Herbaspirillum sp. YR522]|uniref:hypothetical protein n=1 Tax=Herbaspirillum sp. YR522 TaxID=1144342 RepID=UPI00026F99FB|nr:hypothetical protein [Herbaspirillum sp. YR522]EJN02950.1 hypothetical protein PMI40_02903 [Herbaspirillum sp. YR522]